MIKIEIATVYRGGNRRFFTLRAACRAEAFEAVTRKYGRFDREDLSDYDWRSLRAERLARWIYRSALREKRAKP